VSDVVVVVSPVAVTSVVVSVVVSLSLGEVVSAAGCGLSVELVVAVDSLPEVELSDPWLDSVLGAELPVGSLESVLAGWLEVSPPVEAPLGDDSELEAGWALPPVPVEPPARPGSAGGVAAATCVAGGGAGDEALDVGGTAAPGARPAAATLGKAVGVGISTAVGRANLEVVHARSITEARANWSGPYS
jgi:hypothetical protein